MEKGNGVSKGGTKLQKPMGYGYDLRPILSWVQIGSIYMVEYLI